MDDKMIEITVRGVDLKIDPRALQDFRLLDMLVQVDEGETLMVVRALRRILGGKKQLDAIMTAIEAENDGWCPMDEMSGALREIVDGISQKDDSAKK